MVVTVVDGEGSGGWTGAACFVIVVLVPCYRSCSTTVVDDEDAGLGRGAPRSLIVAVGEGAEWWLAIVVYGDVGVQWRAGACQLIAVDDECWVVQGDGALK